MLALAAMNSVTDAVPLTLVCHPQSRAQAVRGISAVAGTAPGGSLTLGFTLAGVLSGLHIPESRQPRQADGLWRHTCFEAFVMSGEGPGYREFNFSPSGEWAVHAFRGYRDGGELAVRQSPEIMVRRSGDHLQLAVEIRPDLLPPERSLRLGLSVVVEDADGMLSYWALRHPPGRPDFHHPDAFALQLVLP